jgi:hypothetical protein
MDSFAPIYNYLFASEANDDGPSSIPVNEETGNNDGVGNYCVVA